jgi:hypothetical protein
MAATRSRSVRLSPALAHPWRELKPDLSPLLKRTPELELTPELNPRHECTPELAKDSEDEMTDYERQRLHNIRRNAEIMAGLGIASHLAAIKRAAAPRTLSDHPPTSPSSKRRRVVPPRVGFVHGQRAAADAGDGGNRRVSARGVERRRRATRAGGSRGEQVEAEVSNEEGSALSPGRKDDDDGFVMEAAPISVLPQSEEDLDPGERIVYQKLRAYTHMVGEEQGIEPYMVAQKRYLSRALNTHPTILETLDTKP